jgi:hypothetical protein
MMVSALEEFQSSYNVKLEKITCIPLEGEGTIERRVEKWAIIFAKSMIINRLPQGCTRL